MSTRVYRVWVEVEEVTRDADGNENYETIPIDGAATAEFSDLAVAGKFATDLQEFARRSGLGWSMRAGFYNATLPPPPPQPAAVPTPVVPMPRERLRRTVTLRPADQDGKRGEK